jgi:hypothetical protein
MRLFRNLLVFFSGLVFVVPVFGVQSSPQAPNGEGKLQIHLLGNGKICARLHEQEVVDRISPDRFPTRLFTTYGYLFRITALRQGPRPQLFKLLDTGKVKTSFRQEREKPPVSVNPRPDMAMYERSQPYRDVWLKHASCRSFPRFKEFDLPEGEYVLKMEYRVQAPNGTWFRVFEQESAVVEIGLQAPAESRVRFLDDGNRREIFFFEPAEDPETSIDAEPSADDKPNGTASTGSN